MHIPIFGRIFVILLLLFVSPKIFSQHIVKDDFTDLDVSQTPEWKGDLSDFISLNQATFPNATTATDTFFIAAIPSVGKSVLLTESTIIDDWTFSLGSGDFSPSSKNYIGVILMCDELLEGSITDESWYGYYLRIGDDDIDKISLYKRSGNESVIVGYFDTPSFTDNGLIDGISISVSRKNDGTFNLSYKTGFNQSTIDIPGGSLTDDTYMTSSWFGVYQLFNNVSDDRRIFFDNMYLVNNEDSYTWTGTADNDFQNPLNWNPNRPADSYGSDQLQFSDNDTLELINVPSQVIGQLTIGNNTQITLRADGTNERIRISNGADGDDFIINENSELILKADGSNDGLTLSLVSGARASIKGAFWFGTPDCISAGAHALEADDSAAFVFESGSKMIVGKQNGNPFGNSGTNDIVVFKNGASYYCYDGGNPFGKSQPDSKVVFGDSSFYYHLSATAPSYAGRQYGHFVYDKSSKLTIRYGSQTAAACVIYNLTIEQGRMLFTLNGNNKKLDFEIRGNLSINNVTSDFSLLPNKSEATSTITFSGGESQSVGGVGSFIIGSNAILHIANEDVVSLKNDMTVYGDVSFADNGKLELGESDMTIEGDILNANSNQFFITNAAYNATKGFLQMELAKGVSDKLFPVGASKNSYTPCTISNNDGSAAQFQIRVFDNMYEHGKYGDKLDDFHLVRKTWEITPTTGSPEVDILLQWNEVDEGTSFESNLARMSKNKGIDGNDVWRIIPTTETGAAGTNPYELLAADVSDFSKFGVGDDDSPLPVELIFFNANYVNKQLIVEWETASETNSESFVVERSVDGVNYEVLEELAAAGNSNTTLHYNIIDESPTSGTSYYRLMQIDFNGEVNYYDVVSVFIESAWEQLSVYKTSEQLCSISISGNAIIDEIEIYDLSGKQMDFSIVTQQENGLLINLNLPKGVYSLLLKINNRQLTHRFCW